MDKRREPFFGPNAKATGIHLAILVGVTIAIGIFVMPLLKPVIVAGVRGAFSALGQ